MAPGMGWLHAAVWDLKMKMWRKQTAVNIERNPYAKEKLTAKDVFQYEFLWIPILEYNSQNDI